MGSERVMTGNLRGYIIPDSWMYFNDSKPMAYSILEDIFYFCMIYPALVVIINIFSKSIFVMLSGLYLILPIILLTIIRRKTKRFISFFGLNLFLYIISSFIFFITAAPIYLICIYAPFIITASMLSIHIRYNSENKFISLNHFILGEIVILFFYIVAALNGYNFAMTLIIIIEILFSLLFIIYFHIARTDKLLQWEEQNTLIVDKKIHSAKRYFTAGICGLLGIVIYLVFGTGLVKYLDIIENYFLSVLYRLMHPGVSANIVSSQIQSSRNPAMERPAMLDAMIGKSAKPNIFAIYFLKFLEIIIFSIIIIFFIKMLLNIAKSVYQGFYKNSFTEKEERETVFSIDDTSKRFFEGLNSLKNKLIIPFDMSSRVRIRKLYEKIITKYKNQKVEIFNSDTPGEIENSIAREHYYFSTEITELYEKARYSNEDITKEDYENMKKNISLLYKGRAFRKVEE